MDGKSFLIFVVIVASLFGSVYAGPITAVGPPAGLFGLPYDANQTGPYCGTPGYKQDQYHMQWNIDFSKYHAGEDWNGMCGGDTDEGYPLLAVGDGKVVFLDNVGTVSGQGKRLYIRHSFPYAKAQDGVMTFDSALLHLQGMANGITWTQGVPGSGSSVTKGQPVAYLGKTGTTLAHLHWEAQTDSTILLGANPYYNPLTKIDALKYRAPSLIVDDRKQSLGYTVPGDGQWYSFTMQGNAPSSIMYTMYNGERKSLKNAIVAGWIPSWGILHNVNGVWYFYNDVDDNFLENGKQYAIASSVSGVEHIIPVPQNSFHGDRARLDMLHAVENDARFVSIKMDVNNPYGYDPNWDPNWELNWMAFNLSSGGVAYVNQITYKTNRLIRNTSYYDPDLGQWTAWKWVDWNTLY